MLNFEPWDFSEVALATEELSSAFRQGAARAERPPREGVCGTYFIRSENGDVLCVFKPIDEEATDIEMSPPPRSPFPLGGWGDSEFSLGPAHGAALAYSPVSGRGLGAGSVSSESEYESRRGRAGFEAGEGAYKEVAAYMLDHDRFARVPQTALATCQFTTDLPEKNKKRRHIRAHSILMENDDFDEDVVEKSMVETTEESLMKTKMGALQVFVKNVGDADDFGPGVFDRDQVHRIAILDLRTLNHDRHGGNILVAKAREGAGRRYDLIPIDHGYILPDGSCETVVSIPWPVWMDWPMIRQPVSEKIKRYIKHLDAEAEASILDKELDGQLRAGSLQCLKIATTLLQKGVAAGLTLYEIGLLTYTRRGDPEGGSELGKIIKEAYDASKARSDNFMEGNVDGHMPMPMSLDDHHHRRHQSMSALNIPEFYNDDYVVKYGSRKVHELVKRVAEKKERLNERNARKMQRSRSIPNFGIGVRPLHLLVTSGEGMTPAPTPMTSPMAPQGISATEMLEAQMFGRNLMNRRPPIQIPINNPNSSRIMLPELRASPVSDGEHYGDSSNGSIVVDKMSQSSSSDLPPLPLFRNASRKVSPVSAAEAIGMWDSEQKRM